MDIENQIMIGFVEKDFIDLFKSDLRQICQDYERCNNKKIPIKIFELYSYKEKKILLAIKIEGQQELQKSFIDFLDNYLLTWVLSRYDEESFKVEPKTKSEMIMDKI